MFPGKLVFFVFVYFIHKPRGDVAYFLSSDLTRVFSDPPPGDAIGNVQDVNNSTQGVSSTTHFKITVKLLTSFTDKARDNSVMLFKIFK